MDALKELKMNVRENIIPYFSDEELVYYLEKNNGDVRKASYECLILKAETTGLDVSGISTKDSSSYFKMLAQKYVTPNTGTLLWEIWNLNYIRLQEKYRCMEKHIT